MTYFLVFIIKCQQSVKVKIFVILYFIINYRIIGYFIRVYKNLVCIYKYQSISNQNLLDQISYWQATASMQACFASFNTKGFSSSLSNPYSGSLPAQTHITYDGCFNELKYSIGPKAKKRMELYLGYARAQNSSSSFDSEINNFLTVFTKGSKDGQDRDDRVLNAVIVLDISGSMGGELTSKGEGNRLQLAKQAILMFVSKLRPNDSFGLVVFNNQAKTLIPVQKASTIEFDKVSQILKTIQAGGGTTLMTGFQESLNQLKTYLSANQSVKNKCESRFIILTDVQDNSVANSKHFIEQIEQSEIHTTIIGISDAFKSDVCEELSEVKGFNYFCATQVGDLKKYLFENFSFTFFPDTYDIEISVKNDNIRSIEVYGTNDSAKVPLYNVNSTDTFIITKSKTSFPSELQIGQDGTVKTYGGLVLVKLNLKDKTKPVFQGDVHLKYRTAEGEKFEEDYPFKYESPINEQFYSDQSLYEALSGYFYVHEVKNILKAIKEDGDKPQTRQKYVPSLEKLKPLVPKSKLQELQKLIEKMRKKNPTPEYPQMM